MIELFGLLCAVMLGLMIYFAPTIVASSRGAKNACGILLLNLFLGWMGLGWVIALIWAVCAECEEKEVKKSAPNMFRGGSRGWGEE
jgi:hypothetical protein